MPTRAHTRLWRPLIQQGPSSFLARSRRSQSLTSLGAGLETCAHVRSLSLARNNLSSVDELAVLVRAPSSLARAQARGGDRSRGRRRRPERASLSRVSRSLRASRHSRYARHVA
jgi:hypothetical protein